MQTTDFAGGPDDAEAVALQANGKIVAVGEASFGLLGSDFALARYNPNGSLDTSFSGDGKQSTDFGDGDVANGVALQSDGKIVAVGRGAGSDFALARYNPNGTLDPSFSGDGMQTTDFGFPDSDPRRERSGLTGRREDRRGGRRHWPYPNRRFRRSSLPRRLNHARCAAPRRDSGRGACCASREGFGPPPERRRTPRRRPDREVVAAVAWRRLASALREKQRYR